MTPHDWYVENRAAYVARALEAREERLFADHLIRCEECTREVATLQRDLGPLPMAVAPVAPRPGLSHQLAEGVLRQRARWSQVGAALAAAAAIILAVGLGVRERQALSAAELAVSDRDRQLAALRDTLSIMRQAHVVQRDIAMDGHKGGLVIFDDPVSHRWNVVMHGLPRAPADSVYQFWFITQNGMVRSVELRCDADRPAFATVGMPNTPGAVMGAAVTVEAAASRTGEPTGPMLAHVQF
ncbi:MAG TPA: anti-sigma factor [Gemmatimonadales bacterium]